MGILKQSREQGAGLSRVEREVTVSALCRRRLAVFMVRSGMVETIKAVSRRVGTWFGVECMEWNADFFFSFARLPLLLSRAMSVLVRRSSMILLSWLPATWKISLLGLIPVRSSATSCVTVRSWMTLIFCDRLG